MEEITILDEVEAISYIRSFQLKDRVECARTKGHVEIYYNHDNDDSLAIKRSYFGSFVSATLTLH